MQHRHTRRDPTIPVVVGLALVVALLLGFRSLSADAPATTATSAGTPTAGASAPTTVAKGKTGTKSTKKKASKKKGKKKSALVLPEKPDKPVDLTKPLRASSKMSCVDVGTDTDLTALSYNIKSAYGGRTLGQLSEVLKASQADVVLFQEIDRFAYRSRQVDMPAYFGSQLGFYHAFGPNVDRPGRADYGTAIVSRYPIVSVTNTHLPRPGNTQQRGLLHAVIDVNGSEVSIYNTHLQNQNEPARMLQVAAINRIVSADPRPQILGGDFNAQPESRPLQVLKSHWIDAWGTVGVGDGRTHPASNLRGRIDFLMYANPGITPIVSDVLSAKLSDHMAVRASFTIEGPDDQVCFRKLT